MIRYILPLIISISIISGACSGRKNKTERRDLIPEKDFISILTDVYLADGLLSLPRINKEYLKGDTLTSYIEIIEDHGYSKAQMDRTMRFYFIRKPKDLIQIYDKVLGGLSEMESMVDKELPAAGMREMNIWPGKPFYLYSDRSDSAWLDFPVPNYRTFFFKFTITIYPDDQSVNPYPGLYFSHTDTAGNETKEYFPEIPLLKDGQPHTYKVRINLSLPDPVRLRGWFVNQENISPVLEHHQRIGNIILSRNPVE